jgi:hypothetical protein
MHMTQLTNQEIFDKALFGIRNQDYKKSAKGGSACLYRSTQKDGSTLACAVGHCIPDDVAHLWDADGHDTSIGAIYHRHGKHFSEFFSEESLPLLKELQSAHDAMTFPEVFEDSMEVIALIYRLVYTPPGGISTMSEHTEEATQ